MHKQLSNDVCFTTVTKPRAHQHQAILLSAGHPASQQWESKRPPCSSAQKLNPTGWGCSEQGNNPLPGLPEREARALSWVPWQLSRKGYMGRDAPNKQASKPAFPEHSQLVSPSRDGNHCPVPRIICVRVAAQRRLQKVTTYFGFPRFGGPGDALCKSTIGRRQFLIICDNQAPVRCF